jgi:signal transduction histidine kinase
MIALQFYWLRNSYLIHRERFEKDISEGLSEALEMLLVGHTRNVVTQNYSTRYLGGADDSTHVLEQTSVFLLPDSTLEEQRVTITAYVADEDSFERIDDKHRGRILKKRLDGAEDIEQLMDKVFSTLIHQDLDIQRLDSLYRAELINRKIELEYQLAFYRQDSLIASTADQPAPDMQGPVVTSRGLLPPGYYARASFGKPERLLFSQMGWILSASLAIILLTLVSFWYLLNVIFRQKRLSAIKNDFINNMTHEFKTPISILSAANEAMMHFDVLEDRQKTQRYLGIFKRELERLNGMVEKVLNISIYEKSSFSLQPEVVDIHQLIATLIDRHLVGREAATDIRFEPGLKDPNLTVDKIHFQNVLNNLLDNAIKYSSAPRKITLKTCNEERFAVISFTDNGIGISPTHQGVIFEKFYRVPTGDLHNVKGFGLGLSYVKNMVEKHGGSIAVQSSPGKGSTFTIKLPNN